MPAPALRPSPDVQATNEAPPAGHPRPFVTLGVGGEVFGIDVARVQEILDLRPMARMPQAPPFLLGIIDLRGRAVPVIDLRLKLGLPAAPTTEHSRIVVVEALSGGVTRGLGLLADRVFEVTTLDESGIEPPPEIGIRWRSELIQGVGRRLGAFVIVFDLDRLFSQEEAARWPGQEA